MMIPKNKIWFVEDGHFYFADEARTKLIPSYSAIMAEVYGDKFASVPKDIREKALKKGKAVHRITQDYDEWKTFETENLGGYLKQWIRFKKDIGIKDFDLIETPLFNKKDWYCCTFDRLYKDLLIDIKTGGKYPAHKIQTACQANAINENYGIKINKRMNVYLTETTYKVDIHDEDQGFYDWEKTLILFKKKVFGI